MVIFRVARYKNFLSVGNRFLEFPLDKKPMTLLVGKNGHGKSIILDALCFGLFGKPFRKVNKPQLVNRFNQKDSVVEIEFTVGATDYLVRRGQKPAIFEIERNGKKMDEDAATFDFQTFLEKNILGLNYKTFTQIVILGSATYTPFMQLKAADRRAIVDDLLNTTIFSTMSAVLKKEAGVTKETLTRVENDGKITAERIKMQKKYLADTTTQTKQMSENNKAEIEKSLNDIAAHNAAIDEYNAAITKLRDELKGLSDPSKDIRAFQRIESDTKATMRQLQNELTFFHENDNCPTCKQVIDDEFKADKIATNEGSLEKEKAKVAMLLEQIDAAQKKLDKANALTRQITDMQSKIVKEQSDINAMNNYITKLQDEIARLSENKEAQTEQHKAELAKQETKLKGLVEQHKGLVYEKGLQELASEILKDSGIKAKVIRQYLPTINKLMNHYLKELNFPVSFLLDEEFNETIDQRFGEILSYESFSQGQKMRIDLAVLFTWVEIARAKNSVNTNILFFDEVFDSSLDDDGTDDFMNIIRALGKDRNIVVISHKTDQLLNKFESVLSFELVKNYTKMTVVT